MASSSLLKHIHIGGALFYGPPGTGKTHLSRAVAKASGSSMLAIDSAAVQSQWVGETEKYIKAAFSLASKLFPCVLFIDEVDSLFYRRSGGDHSWQRTALAQFLSDMDGLVTTNSAHHKAPFVVVATNRPQDLDDAFFRRLPQKVSLKLPSEDARAKILRPFLCEDDLDPLVDVDFLARRTKGYSGSDLRNVCAEDAMIWAVEQVKTTPKGKKMQRLRLERSHFARALKKIRPTVSRQTLADLEGYPIQGGLLAVE
ncbi:P-loop containing nucleoside triphosphate hydrolase protein [Lasiosphaeria ovina]|uniref:P-loop containing nucleoside triphosphate hydrolase protein n=1 Tax=Lasiosphaeria ovina TaxID=92902 RepID=A0AAE0NJZ3_9PEZI|nr:P-loop containing nucleoside triphosphate hydrolase protein [Lasiosphaeria ovina]